VSLLLAAGLPLCGDIHRHSGPSGGGGILEFKDIYLCAATILPKPITVTVTARPKQTNRQRSSPSQHRMSDEKSTIKPAIILLSIAPTNRVTKLDVRIMGLQVTGGVHPYSAYGDPALTRAAAAAAAARGFTSSSSSSSSSSSASTPKAAAADRLRGYSTLPSGAIIEAGALAALPSIAVKFETEDGMNSVPPPEMVAGLSMKVVWTPTRRAEPRDENGLPLPNPPHPQTFYLSSLTNPEIVRLPSSSASSSLEDKESAPTVLPPDSKQALTDTYVLFQPDQNALPMTNSGNLSWYVAHQRLLLHLSVI
jgi:hypothetical protein